MAAFTDVSSIDFFFAGVDASIPVSLQVPKRLVLWFDL